MGCCIPFTLGGRTQRREIGAGVGEGMLAITRTARRSDLRAQRYPDTCPALEVPLRRHHCARGGRHLDLCDEGDDFAHRAPGAIAAIHLEMDNRLDPIASCCRCRHVHLAVLHSVVAGRRRDDTLLDPCTQLARAGTAPCRSRRRRASVASRSSGLCGSRCPRTRAGNSHRCAALRLPRPSFGTSRLATAERPRRAGTPPRSSCP